MDKSRQSIQLLLIGRIIDVGMDGMVSPSMSKPPSRPVIFVSTGFIVENRVGTGDGLELLLGTLFLILIWMEFKS